MVEHKNIVICNIVNDDYVPDSQRKLTVNEQMQLEVANLNAIGLELEDTDFFERVAEKEANLIDEEFDIKVQRFMSRRYALGQLREMNRYFRLSLRIKDAIPRRDL